MSSGTRRRSRPLYALFGVGLVVAGLVAFARDRQRRTVRSSPASELPSAESAASDHVPDEPTTSSDDARALKIMEASELPGNVVVGLASVAVIAIGWYRPRFFINPIAVRHLRHVVDGSIALTLFLVISTLTLFLYSSLYGRDNEVVKKFTYVVLNRAGIGAALGTLVGCRIAPVLLAPTSAHRASFPEYLGDVGNIITLMTLAFVGTAWIQSIGAFKSATTARSTSADVSSRRPPFPVPIAAVIVTNYVAIGVALSVYSILAND